MRKIHYKTKILDTISGLGQMVSLQETIKNDCKTLNIFWIKPTAPSTRKYYVDLDNYQKNKTCCRARLKVGSDS